MGGGGTSGDQEAGTAGAGTEDVSRRAARLLLGGEPRYTRGEAARLAGVCLDRADQLWRSLGYPNPSDTDAVFTEADVAALRTVTDLRQAGVTDATSELALARALGQAMAGLSESHMTLLRNQVTATGRSDTEAASATLARAELLIPKVESLLSYVWRRHLLAASERILAATPSPDSGTAVVSTAAVGFVDIAGFTSLTRGLSEQRLAEFLETFESGVSAVVTAHGGRVIKTVGDEVMFAADTPTAGADIALDLAERVSELDGRPDLHVGLAFGPVLSRLGDLYGTVVNLAARLCALARAGTVLVDLELARALEENPAYQLRRLRRVSVRGFSHLQPWLLRRGN